MIAHLHGREQALEPFGWKERKAEWIALACLHSGAFTRAQATRFLDTHHERARRLVHALIAHGLAAEETVPRVRGIGRVCRICSYIIVSPCHYSTYHYTPIYCPLITPLFLNGNPVDRSGGSRRRRRSEPSGRAVCRWPLSSRIANDSDSYRLRSLGTAAARGDLFSDPRIHFGLDPADGARA